MSKKYEIKWFSTQEDQDYAAARSYLDLIYDADCVDGMIEQLKGAFVVNFEAKDIFQASGLSPLGISKCHVKKERKRIRKGLVLAPLVLIRDKTYGKLVIADGYHRMCAVYKYDEDALIPCKII